MLFRHICNVAHEGHEHGFYISSNLCLLPESAVLTYIRVMRFVSVKYTIKIVLEPKFNPISNMDNHIMVCPLEILSDNLILANM